MMKYCSKCGTKNEDNSVFCTKCGNKFKKETDSPKIVLLVGVFMVMFSSFFFGILNWENMDNLFRLLFFCFESCLFFLMSLALKKVSNKVSRFFFVIGLILTPFTLSLIPYYNLIPSILYNEALIFIYLAVIWLIAFVSYILINFKFKGKILNYLSLVCLLIALIFGCLIFTKNITIIGLVITIYMFAINLFTKILKENERVYYIFSLILSFLIVPFLIVCYFNDSLVDKIINIISTSIFIADTYIKLCFNKKSILHFFAPFMLNTLLFCLISLLFSTHILASLIVISIVTIILYFITEIFKNQLFSNTTLVVSYLTHAFLILYCMIVSDSMALVILSSIYLIFNLCLVIIKKYNFAHFFITVNVLLLVTGLNNWLYNFDSLIIIGFLFIVYLIIYLVLNLINNKYDFIYLIIMLIIGFFTSFGMFINYEGFTIIKLIICITFTIGFVLSNTFNENVAVRVIWFIILNLLILPLFSNIYYSLLTISILTIILSVILQKATKNNFKPHILYAEIIIFIITLFNTMEHNTYSLFINVLAFILGFLCLVKLHNKKVWKIAYVMVGLLYIIKLTSVIIEPIVISSLISILIVLIIIISMYLLDTFTSKELVIISLVSLIPYYSLIEGLYYYDAYAELYLIPFVIYSIILIFAIKWKNDTNRNVFILIPFFVFAFIFVFLCNGGVISTIIDVIFAVTYMIIALVKKYNLLIFFSIGVLVLSIFLQLFTVLNSMIAIISLLIVGFILIFVAILYITKKKD